MTVPKRIKQSFPKKVKTKCIYIFEINAERKEIKFIAKERAYSDPPMKTK